MRVVELTVRRTPVSPARSGGSPLVTQAGGRRDFGSLLPVLLPAFLLALVLSIVRTNLVVADTWTALVAGREIAAHGLPSVEHLTRISDGRQWIDQQWLAQLVLYGAAAMGGVGLAITLC